MRTCRLLFRLLLIKQIACQLGWTHQKSSEAQGYSLFTALTWAFKGDSPQIQTLQ